MDTLKNKCAVVPGELLSLISDGFQVNEALASEAHRSEQCGDKPINHDTTNVGAGKTKKQI